MYIRYSHPFMQQASLGRNTASRGEKYIVKLQLNKLKLARVKQPTLKLQKAQFCPQQLLKSKLPSVDLCEFNCLEAPATSEFVSLIWEIAEPSLGSLWRRDHLATPQSIKCEHRMQLESWDGMGWVFTTHSYSKCPHQGAFRMHFSAYPSLTAAKA